MKTDDAPVVLIIENDEEDIELILRAIKMFGMKTEQLLVKDGQSALDFLFPKGKNWELSCREIRSLLLDLKMPRVNGLEVLSRIKSDEGTSRIPVVVFSSSQEERDIELSYRLGANSYVQKPFSFKEMLKVVSGLLGYWTLINRLPNRED